MVDSCRRAVRAYEVDATLAGQASANMAHVERASVVHASGAQPSLPEADVIYVNAGVTAPPPAWLDALRIGGRLVLPLTAANWYGWWLSTREPTQGQGRLS